jgi:hypothetical protein
VHNPYHQQKYVNTLLDTIGNGDFFRNPILKNSLEYANDNSKAVHIMGLLSDGGVHSHEEQMYAMLEMSKQYGCQEVYLHIFADGRDCAQKSAKNYILKLEDKITEFGTALLLSFAYSREFFKIGFLKKSPLPISFFYLSRFNLDKAHCCVTFLFLSPYIILCQ